MNSVSSIAVDILLVMFICLLSIYGYFLYSYKYWAKRKTPYLEPRFPYGNRQDLLCYTKGFALELMDLYREIRRREWKFGGFYGVAWPVLMVTDPEYMKDILKKDFHHFIDRGFYYQKHESIGQHLFVMDESNWRETRSKLTPTFTSGKMKMMFPLMVKASDGLIEALNKLAGTNHDVDSKDYLARFTTDVIVSCAFGLDSNCFTDPNNQFRKMGINIFGSKGILDSISLIFKNYAPDFALKIRLSNVRKEMVQFLMNIISKTINYRKENNVKRADFLQLVINMMEETKNTEKPFTLEHLVANVNLFFIAGFDTSATALNFAFYELARNPDIQERLRDEIKTTLKGTDEDLTYDVINEMTYLQQVIDETLRLYPSVPVLQRKCIKDYKLRDTEIVIEKGMPVVMSIIAMHRDPEYYPDPMKFDPDRFSPDNKSKINQNCYLPFGDGPRNCIGLRFGLMQTKVGIVQILKHFKLKISPSTTMALTIDKRSFLLQTKEKLYLTLEKI